MIPRIQASGGSFRGAGQYYLHDKSADSSLDRADKPQTDERVWFTDTRNCLNTDPKRALDEMWRTAEDQAWLKSQAGVARGGRVCEDPVKTLSLAWHKDDQPTPEHMVAAADSFLKHMGWDKHQAVYVGHNDTEHRHIHIILNRVNPENGRTLDDYREQKRAQVWALAYEREHGQVRCEQREINAMKREGPAVEAERGPAASQHQQPANDHLPHNVVMITRPMEQAFDAHEQQREQRDKLARDQLKAEQRAEREAFFADGAKLFKATRHAVYDGVRKEYAPEWRQFYKDAEAAEKSAEAWSDNAVTRALYFAKDGRWDDARGAFGDRDSVRDAVTSELADRKADLKARQMEDVRERQRDACDALREVRDVQYQELLQHQREERAAFKAGQVVADFGHAPEQAATREPPANVNVAAVDLPVPPPAAMPAQDIAAPGNVIVAPEQTPSVLETAVQAGAVDRSDEHSITGPTLDAPEPIRQVSDLAAGAIGSVASYIADQLGEMFAPTPPEVREAQAKADAKREAEKPVPDDKAAIYARIVDAAVKGLEDDRATGKDDAYWKERDRGKDWERDR